MLDQQNVLVCISGGIAAYKTPDLVRKLISDGANVRVVLTDSASHFVSPMSLQAVSGNKVSNALLDEDAEAAMGHIELARWADIMLIAPATANTMAKLANGIADDLMTTLYLASNAPCYIAPAMNQQMWQAASVTRNLKQLIEDGCHIIGPAIGEQACGDTGPGRMTEPQDIVSELNELTKNDKQLNGKNIVITAGPTRESIDPVRYMTNHSSGKMGFAIAKAARKYGASVTLISGPVQLSTPLGVTRIDVQSAIQMHEATLSEAKEADIFIACAAVADYRPATTENQKIKKSNEKLTLTFVKNPDILKDVAALEHPPYTLGFAAESEHVEEYARKKLSDKRINMIAANNICTEGLGFDSDNNALHVMWGDQERHLSAKSKTRLAEELLELLISDFTSQ